MVSLAAIGLWSAGSTVMDDPISFGTIYQAAIVYLPAIWAMLAIALLLMGINPSLTGLTWLYLGRSEEHTSELQSRGHLVCRLLLEKKNKKKREKSQGRK